MSRELRKSDEGQIIVVRGPYGEDHCAVLLKFEEEPGMSRIKYLNEFGDRPTDKSRFHEGKDSVCR